MASGGGDGHIGDFYNFTSKTLPKVVAPVGASMLRNSSQQSTSGWDETENSRSSTTSMEPVQSSGLDYVQQFIEEEQVKISKIKLGSTKNLGSSQSNISRGGRYGRQRGRGRGHGRQNENGNACGGLNDSFRRDESPESIYGTIPDALALDTEVFYKYDFNQLLVDTSGLVINRVREKILAELTSHQVMTIEGFTGCGKTTQVPQFILDEAVKNETGCMIAVTQPRRIAAISVANRVASERNWRVGGIVGYQVGMDKCTSQDTRLTYMTTGVLLQLLISRKSIGRWSHIIIDEVHGRDLETDLLLLVIRKIMVDTANDKTRIILMSATLNPAKFTGYFPLWDNDNFSGRSVNIKVDLPNQYPVEELYLEDAANAIGYENYSIDSFEEPKIYRECFAIAKRIIDGLDSTEGAIHDKAGDDVSKCMDSRGAVLIFLPGLLEIEAFYKTLTEDGGIRANKNPEEKNVRWSVLPLHSSITNEEQQRVFLPARNGFRKIILATNIAESSITVPDIKYVIDFCLIKNLSCDPTTNYTCLRLEWASKNQCVQRRGRCGRVSSGTVYRMVSKKFYETLEQEAQPEMLRSSLESVVLQVKLLDMGSPKSVLALAVDPPNEYNIRRAVSNLKEIGALTIQLGKYYDAFDGCLTFVGRVLSRLPIDIRLGRLILLGHAFDCLEEAIIIAAGLSVKSPFAYPYSRRLEAYMSKLMWSTKSFSDCLALYYLYTYWFRKHQRKEFRSFSDEKTWAKANFVQVTSLKEMKMLIDELYKRLKICGIVLTPSKSTGEEQILLLKVVIAGAFYPNYFHRVKPNARDYQKAINRDVSGRDPLSSVAFHGFPMEQPGELYKKIVGRAVSYENCIPHIEMQGSRVIVTFQSRCGSTLGSISLGVYRAVKLRQLRQFVTFGIPSRDVAVRMLGDRKMRMDSYDIILAPPQLEMPGLRSTCIPVFMTHIESPSEFFVVALCNETNLKLITEKLDEFKINFTSLRREQCQIGVLCIISSHGTYYRGRIDAERNNCDDVMIFLIDRGLSKWSHRSHVFLPGKDFLQTGMHLTPGLAWQCRLSEVQPGLQTDFVWSYEAVRLFDAYCCKNYGQVFLKVYGIANGLMSTTVRNTEDDGCLSVNEILLNKKYAMKFTEPQPFQENYVIREKVKFDLRPDVLSNYKTFEQQQNNCLIPERWYDPPNLGDDADQLISLRGPHSPLEMTFAALCGLAAHPKQVLTDSSSVNSVVLDSDPSTPAARLMVAANVAIAQHSRNILARETTVMPPIPGLTGLLAMLFCPKVEFRVNGECTTYTGCLTGLGIDSKTGDSAYPDHDMEVVFDTVIDNEDVSLVNSIRSAMNSILSDKVSDIEMRNLRDRMRLEAFSLLEREREGMEEILPEKNHKWSLPRSKSRAKTFERDADSVFPLHDHIKLLKTAEAEEELEELGLN